VTSTLIGIAQGQHRLGSLDQPIISILPVTQTAAADPRKQRITVANLLSMTSGLDCRGNPAENVLLEMEQSPHWADFMLARPQAFDPGTTSNIAAAACIWFPLRFPEGSAKARSISRINFCRSARDRAGRLAGGSRRRVVWFCGLELQPRDAAKLGHLWLHRGLWKDQQLRSHRLHGCCAHAARKRAARRSIWLRHVALSVARSLRFQANGRGGQRITVVPEQDLVEVATAGGVDENRIAPLLAEAVKANHPLPPNPVGVAWLAKIGRGAALPPVAYAPAAAPQWAPAIAGKTWLVSANPLGFPQPVARLRDVRRRRDPLRLRERDRRRSSFGLDGVPRVSVNKASGHRVALVGRWSDNAFDLDYDEIARINAYRLHFVPVDNGLGIRITERSGLADITLTATPAAVN